MNEIKETKKDYKYIDTRNVPQFPTTVSKEVNNLNNFINYNKRVKLYAFIYR